MNQYVLDAYALLALFLGEPRGARVQQLLRQASEGAVMLAMSLINYGECVYNVERRYDWIAVEKLHLYMDAFPITLWQVDRARILAAAHIKAQYPLSYADAFAVALAQELQATLVTGDPEFHAVERLVKIEWLTG